jgi:hypothetical protein
MKVKTVLTTLLMLTLVVAFGLMAQGSLASPAQQTAVTEAAADTVAMGNLYGVSETGLYIVRFKDPGLASYTGGIAGLAATSPESTGARKLDANSPASRAYLQYLTENQDQFAAELSQKLGRSVEVAFNYTGVLNAMAVAVSHEEAAQIAAMPGVAAVYGDTYRELTTDVGPGLIGAPAIWNGDTGYGVGTRGEGIIIGVIDSGINSQHPSFAATDGDGYSHTNPYGAGVYKGWCATNPGFCNAKLIAAYGLNPVGATPEDTDGHGSHTASTAGGNAHTATFDVGNETYNIPIQGVAPRANIVAYKVCNPSCPGTASIAAVNSAINNDMVDVLNYSISGSDSPWTDPVDLAFLDASNAGIYVSASAGNSGPGPSTVAKTGPWNASTAASTHNRAIVQTVDVTGPTTPPALQDLAAVPGEGTSIASNINSGIRYDATNNQGCTAFTPGTFTGNLALIQRGGCTFAVKVNNAVAAGATGVVLFNSVSGPPLTAGGLTGTPPVVMLTLEEGLALRDYVVANPTSTTVQINSTTQLVYVDEWEDIVAGFSSRGPSQFEILKPDYIAPGVNILAAVEAGATPAQYGFLQGTSMSSPHGAGAAALMMALQPTWSPAEVRSAMATTAVNGLLKEDGVTPADPFDIGSGRLDLSLASTAGLVFNETGANYAAANPAIGGDPKTLNQPSVVNYNCTGECTWTRTVKSTLPISATYTASFSGPAGMTATVTPSTFTIESGATQVITITADVSALAPGGYAFGSITLSTDAVWPDPAPSGAGTMAELLNESFADATFPPAGWATYNVDGGGTQWARTTLSFNSSPASARHVFGASGYDEEGWLVTPQITLDSGVSTLTFAERTQWPTWYFYQGVWVSTNSCNPADGDFVELAEVQGTDAWRTVSYDLSAYADETICIGFAYEGDDATTWYIDDVVVTSFSADTVMVADTNIPVVVVPALATPVITVDADELSATQTPNAQTTQTFAIGNEGGVDLLWEIAEAPVSMRLGLTLDAAPEAAPESSPISFVLDDGVGENSIGLTNGGQFVWLNRFTPGTFNFPITIDQVDVMFGYPASTGGVLVGELIDIYLYEDADGNPANGATHVASLTGQAVQSVDGTTWSTYTLAAPATFNGPGDILIAVVNRTAGVAAGTFPAVLDQTPPSQQRSWAGFGAVPGNPPDFTTFPTFTLIDAFFPGNWLVRGFGTGNFPCENPADVPWLSVDPTTGTTGAAGTTNVSVTFDSTGLTPGDYSAFLCIESNDPDTPLVELPVMLEVSSLPTIEVDIDEIESTQETDTQTTHTMVISNTGEANLNWYFEEAEGMMAGPVPAIMSSLTVGSDRANPQPNAAPASALAAAEPASVAILPTSSNVINAAWSEGFDDVTLLPGMGWAIINNSTPVGTATWFQGNDTVFPAHSGAPTSYIGVNFNSVAGANTISNWLLTPEFMFNNGDSFSFWTRTGVGSAWPDRLEVRWSGNGGSTDVGATATSVGDFDTLLLSVNPALTVGGYPEAWTQFTVDISGLSGPTSGRLAFRYFVTNGGPSGANSNYIGIDTFEYTPAPPMVLYDNGPWITSFGDGPGGSDVSLLQNVSLGLTTLGASVNLSAGGPHFRIADEFEVTTPGGWTVNNVAFYGYQTGSTTTSSFTGVNFRIWDGPPNDPNSNIVFGDTTTNRFESTDWTGVYRYAESAIGNTTRPVMQIVGEAGVHLMPGTYWLDWQLAGTIASGPWQPPITIIGQNTTGNAMQLAAAGWQPFLDGGTGTPAQGAPFQLWGETVCDNPSDVSWISLDPDSGMTAPGGASEVEVTLDSTGVPAGHYVAYLCLNSDDPSNELIIMPVHMTVTETSYLRVAHLAPFAMDPGTAVTITLNGAPALTDFAYGDSTTYIELPSGEYDVEVWPAGSDSPAITATVELVHGMYYSAIAYGDGDNQDLGLMLLEDDNTAPAAGKFHLRLGHLAPFAAGLATADIRLEDGTLILGDVNFTDVTGYIELDAGEYDLKITTPGGDTTLINPLPVTFAEGAIVTAFATGDGVNQDVGVFAWPVDVEGFFLPLGETAYILYLPLVAK